MAHEDAPNPSPASPAEQVAALESRVARLEQQLRQLQNRQPQPAPESSPTRTPPPPGQAPPPPPPPPHPGASTFVPAPSPHISLEDRLGAQVFNRIGIVAVLCGAALFLK